MLGRCYQQRKHRLNQQRKHRLSVNLLNWSCQVDRPPKNTAMSRLQKLLEKVPELEQTERGSPDFQKWHRNTEVAIAHTFGEESRHVSEFRHVRYVPFIVGGTPTQEYQSAYLKGLKSAKSLLESMAEEINDYWPGEVKDTPSPERVSHSVATRDVFVVHGRDDGTKETVARFLQKLDFRPIILHEQPSRGRTIIEKFESHVQAAFAIALLTPDDVGALASESHNLKCRARQNVILEFGYFMGRLGRERVCAIVAEGVEIPSDYEGVVYIRLDDRGAWRMELVREMQAADLEVDANRAL